MATKIKKNLKDLKKFIPQVKKEFKNAGSVNKIEDAVRNDILRGVSPVKGRGRFKKYSQSYKDQIRGKIDFRVINGVTVPFFGSKKTSRKTGRKLKSRKALETTPVKFGKKLAPVNMKLTGDMLDSFSVKTKGSIFAPGQFRLIFKFNSVLADIHNRLGAAGKTIRRLLPTESGEQFNAKLQRVMKKELQKAVSKVVKKTNRR